MKKDKKALGLLILLMVLMPIIVIYASNINKSYNIESTEYTLDKKAYTNEEVKETTEYNKESIKTEDETLKDKSVEIISELKHSEYIIYTLYEVSNNKNSITYRTVTNGIQDKYYGEMDVKLSKKELESLNIELGEYYLVEIEETMSESIPPLVVCKNIRRANDNHKNEFALGRQNNSNFKKDFEQIKKMSPADAYNISLQLQYTWTYEQIEVVRAWIESEKVKSKEAEAAWNSIINSSNKALGF